MQSRHRKCLLIPCVSGASRLTNQRLHRHRKKIQDRCGSKCQVLGWALTDRSSAENRHAERDESFAGRRREIKAVNIPQVKSPYWINPENLSCHNSHEGKVTMRLRQMFCKWDENVLSSLSFWGSGYSFSFIPCPIQTVIDRTYRHTYGGIALCHGNCCSFSMASCKTLLFYSGTTG